MSSFTVGFFTVGNLLTLGIMVLAFLLYHQLSRRGRSLAKLREYGRRLKEELAAYAEEKGAVVRDYGLSLEVQQQSAKELLKRLVITDQELAEKAAAIAKIEERINGYDAALAELDRMTGRVEENLSRIENESAFVETAAKRIHAAEEKLKGMEKSLVDIELRFERENAVSLERMAESLIASVRSTVSDLHAAAETIERKVEDHREAVDKVEAGRQASLDRDLELITKTLKDALAQAGNRADKLEDAALVKLREQALERVQRFQNQVEEKLKGYLENAKARVTEVQGLLHTLKGEWKSAQAEMEAGQKSCKNEWKQDITELNVLARKLREDWKKTSEEAAKENRELLGSLERIAEETSRRITAEAAGRDEAIAAQAAERDRALAEAAEKQNEAIAAAAAAREQHLLETATERERRLADEYADRAAAFSAETGALENRVREVREEIAGAVAKTENLLAEQDQAFASYIAGQERLLAEAAEKQNEAIAASAAEREQRLLETATERERRLADEYADRAAAFSSETAAQERREREVREEIAGAVAKAENLLAGQDQAFAAHAAEQERLLAEAAEKQNEAIAASAAEREQRLLETATEQERRLAGEYADRAAAFSAETAALENRLQDIQDEIGGIASRTETVLADALSRAEDRARVEADAELRRWKASAGENFAAWEQSVSAAEAETRSLLSELETASGNLRKHITAEITEIGERFTVFERQTETAFTELERRLLKTAEDTEQKTLEVSEERLEEYRLAQAEQFRRLDSLAEDSSRLDGELRRYMQDTETRVRQDFARFEQEASRDREAVSEAFTNSATALRADLGRVEQELASLKKKAYDNVSEKLQIFDEDFTADLSKRSEDIDRRLAQWRTDLDVNLAALADAAAEERRKVELSLSEELRRRLAEQDTRLIAELEHLKAETAAFEEGIRGQMAQGDESLRSFKEQLERDMAEARTMADISVKAELGRHALSVADTLKQAQRDLSASLREITDQVEERNGELTGLADASRRELEDWQARIASQIRDADSFMNDIRRRTRELAAETDEQIAGVRSAMVDVQAEASSHRTEFFTRVDEEARRLDSLIKEADRHIKEFVTQTKLFEQTDALKRELEQHIEDFRGDLDRLEQRRSEAAELEVQFVKIKRLEDEINAKMNNFLAEKRRIELMEKDFNQVIQTSVAMESKLAQISASDDTLQAMQIRIRKLDDAMAEAEEKYQRIERKNQTLETTNEGIDRNFKALLETETSLKNIGAEIGRLIQEKETLNLSVENLGVEIGKAQKMADKLTVLDGELSTIEERLTEMQTAREWLARTETRLTELDKELQDKIKLLGTALKKEGGKGVSRDKGAPPILTRENVIKLARQGWTVSQISEAYNLSKGEVELILEIGSKE
jgi:DNA repair exonuclease SbcCD ATPase subunit